MAYQQVKDVVEHVRSLHRRLRDAVEKRRGDSDNERQTLLLRYIEEHEGMLDDALRVSVPEGDEAVLETWLQFTPNAEVEPVFRELESDDELDPDELVKRVLEAEDTLVQLYRICQGVTSAPRVQTFFASLLEMAESAERRYARVRLELRDV